MSYGDMLRNIRKKGNMTQTEMAMLIGKTAMYISNVEKGKNGPLKGKDLDVIIKSLHVTEIDEVKIKSLALMEGQRFSEELISYFRDNPFLLELVVTLYINNVSVRNEEVLKKYYERIRKNNV